MSLIVQKYGGSSVSDAAAIKRVANARAENALETGKEVVA